MKSSKIEYGDLQDDEHLVEYMMHVIGAERLAGRHFNVTCAELGEAERSRHIAVGPCEAFAVPRRFQRQGREGNHWIEFSCLVMIRQH